MAATTARPLGLHRREQRRHGLRSTVLLAALVPLGMGALTFVLPLSAYLLVLVAAAVALSPWIFREPVRGLYLAIGCAVVFDVFPLVKKDSLLDRVPIFNNLSSAPGGLPFSISPFEVLLAVTALAVLFNVGSAKVALPRGPVVAAYAAYAVMVAVAEFHGLSTGGDFNTSLWEVRPQAYAFAGCVLAGATVRDRRQVLNLLVVAATAAALKSTLGTYRYLVTTGRSVSYGGDIMAHEESFFVAVLVVALLVAAVFVRRRRVVLPLLAVAPVALITVLANQRRAGVLALQVALVLVVLLAVIYERPVRGRLVVILIAAAGLLTVATLVFWSHQSGILGQLERPVHSIFGQTDARDYASNLYRTGENANIILTFRASPLYGVGFGSQMRLVFPMADISDLYPLWRVIPHNSILWVLMRMGILGFAALWGLFGIAIARAASVLRLRTDALTVAAAALIIAVVVMEIIVGYTDLQWENYRTMAFFGLMVGLIEPLHRMAAPARLPPARRRGAPIR